ncbi:alpha/beta hydrolase [Brooklawnia cerclae]|uniref:Carboxylesterase n=1 Tax=Brooklawnia cerclae TaxID=349934 RepID=A0ABX0SGN7_9ACTN|nr:carboxylesterase [Brooklawnia cerclae]
MIFQDGSEAIQTPGGNGPLQGTGVLLCHGFSGSPASVRDWGKHLASLGAAVACPLLPGHGTTWRQMALTTYEDWYSVLPPALDWLREHSRTQVVAGLSMGGALALRVAQREPVAAVVLVNPSIGSDSPVYRFAGLLSHIVPAAKGVGSDIRKPGVVEPAYDRAPLAAVASMRRLWRLVTDDLDRVDVPVQLFTSRTDHVVDGYSRRVLLDRLPLVEHHWLEDSYHVATMDHDAGFVFDTSAAFIREVASGGGATQRPE